MEVKWRSSEYEYDKIILAGDVGGTNANLALVGVRDGKFTIILETVSKSAEINEILEPLKKTLETAVEKSERLKPELCCISAAGPVENNYCNLTNCDWSVDGNKIEKSLGIKTLIINDFLAVSYGILTLDVNDDTQITKIPHADGSIPEPEKTTKAVMGPGTGLGVSYITYDKGKYIPNSSEGGHAKFAYFDEETKGLKEFLIEESGKAPGVEPVVSGTGICNIFEYYKAKKDLKIEGIFEEIDKADNTGKPYLISINAKKGDEVCGEMMRTFMKMYASYASSLSLILLPFGGLYLAGGITAKEETLLFENNLFMQYFESCYSPNHEQLLKKIPVYMVKDYSVSIYGAANAAINLI
ncbi:glucokinase [Verrucomicrobiota bacterium]